MRLHRRFYFVLRRLQFFLERVPFVVLGKLIDTIAAAEDVLAHPERFRQFDNVGPDVLYLLTVFRFNRNESVRDQAPEIKRGLGAVLVTRRDRSAHLADPIRFTRLFERRNKFARSWNADGMEPNRLGPLIGRQTRRFGTDHCATAEQKCHGAESPYTPHERPAYAP